MASAETIVSATLDVTSGALCFGSLGDILQGAAAAIQVGPSPRPRGGGTVKYQPMVHNVGAKTGTWNAYTLFDVTPLVSRDEITKILRVAGSPYEDEHGSTMNTDKTKEEGVFVINRYDWGMAREEDNFPDEAEEEADILANGNSLGLVDYSHATSYVQAWTQRKPSQRGALSNGMWMYIPYAEYMFGRFGFEEEYTQLRSFLFFTARTNFFSTKFPGQENPLRKYETGLERFQRGLREGRDYSGIEDIHKLYDYLPLEDENVVHIFPIPPPDSEQLGPYPISEHVLKAEDIEALRVYRTPKADYEMKLRQSHPLLQEDAVQSILAGCDSKIAEFPDEWKDPTYDLLNELVLSYLEHFILTAFPLHGSIFTIGAAMFPKNGHIRRFEELHIDTDLYSLFTKSLELPVPGFDAAAVGSRIRDFLSQRAGEINASPDVLDPEMVIQGITRVVAYLVSLILNISNNSALARERPDRSKPAEGGYIVPSSIKMAVYYDADLGPLIRYSAVYWSGRVPRSTLCG
ncbi:hypothetical protein OIDMADRAFT_51317 [Oidiodendron maius Zn]|uniref:Uncharacterized protein n=1 Tax=Oidiodendron maius (strain Zn) TaxID=913774 RepID=A0A0C3DMU4_OIDMZ|nr:hypothetical protein OIDMADRAFT_51317 [Oidiodendron maius Zn]